MKRVEELINQIREFSRARDWEQFHSPKNISMALAAEAGELLAEFQWLTEDASRSPDEAVLARIRDEVGDVFIYLLDLCDHLRIDPIKAAEDKMIKNAGKYPIETARGSARKYTEL
ncbi:MAG TPA: nucleotide pyrophosphohydrolase [bacterium]|nr:nucleotide pyrophosphohydrolase [bacterium]